MLKKTLFKKKQCSVLSGYIIKYSKKDSFLENMVKQKKRFVLTLHSSTY